MGRAKAQAMGLKPMALLRGYSFVGVDPRRFGISPVKAIPAALKKAGLTLGDIELIKVPRCKHPELIDRMIAEGRPDKKVGKGFYAYEDGK
jgi:3-hydroxyacyl-CoA dehydrogenase